MYSMYIHYVHTPYVVRSTYVVHIYHTYALALRGASQRRQSPTGNPRLRRTLI